MVNKRQQRRRAILNKISNQDPIVISAQKLPELKKQDIAGVIDEDKPDVILVNESWLNSDRRFFRKVTPYLGRIVKVDGQNGGGVSKQ